MVIDDDADILDVITAVLQEAGYRVIAGKITNHVITTIRAV